ncbi:MAG: rhodanese-like domain-containing protein [Deltaproteobacteria bacterium]
MLKKIKQLFEPVKSVSVDEAREFLQEHEEGTFTLLDVRQPKEYDQGHIPGSKLIPLPQLTDSLDQLDPEKPVVAY